MQREAKATLPVVRVPSWPSRVLLTLGEVQAHSELLGIEHVPLPCTLLKSRVLTTSL